MNRKSTALTSFERIRARTSLGFTAAGLLHASHPVVARATDARRSDSKMGIAKNFPESSVEFVIT
jgi:hypothetical protein